MDIVYQGVEETKTFNNQGYIKTTNGGTPLHRLKLKTFINIFEDLWPEEKWIVHHKDGNSENNITSNLQIMTKEEHGHIHISGDLNPSKNLDVAKKISNHAKTRTGSKNSNWRYNIDWDEIKDMKQSGYTQQQVAKLFGIHDTNFCRKMKNEIGITWRQL